MAHGSARGRTYRRLQARVFAEEDVCWLCGWPVDQTLPPGNPRSKSLDHVLPVSRGGSKVDRDNARLAHFNCNSRRGNRAPARMVRTSRPW
ncbi:MAG: HNH endonuclease [Nocardioidaceae bacterium]